MRFRCVGRSILGFIGVVLLSHAGPVLPVSAQYLFLDANGDGANTSADVIAPSGNTTLEVWLKTDKNRDGTDAICATGEALTINSYEFNLRTTNGNLTWGAYTNRQPDMATSFGLLSSPTQYHNGFGGGAILPSGTYHLGTLIVSPSLGTPSITIVPYTTLPGGAAMPTSFGSQCSGNDFDNTMKLGSDWFDADGVAYGGQSLVPPVLGPVADMVVDEGAVATQPISGTDGDGQALAFEKVSGPAYMTVETNDPGAGVAAGTIRLEPDFTNGGQATGAVRVTDGISTDQRSFAITVNDRDRPPVINTADVVSLSTTGEGTLSATIVDPDGGPISIAMTSLPPFVATFLNPRDNSVNALSVSTFARPAREDVGSWWVVFEGTDGISRIRARSRIDVTGPAIPAMPSRALFDAAFTSMRVSAPVQSMASGDLNGDGIVDVVAGSDAAGTVTILYGHRSAQGFDLEQGPEFLGKQIGSVAVADMDGDGHDDVVYIDEIAKEVVVIRGPILGSAEPREVMSLASPPFGLRLGDWDGDGRPDAAFLVRGRPEVMVLRNHGNGTFEPPQTIVTVADAAFFHAADVTGDGHADLVAMTAAGKVWVHPGAGDGTFSSPVETLLPSPMFASACADLNGDGRADVVIIGTFGYAMVFRSLGTGAFGPPTTYSDNAGVSPITLADIDHDGDLDLLRTGEVLSVRLGRPDGTFDSTSKPYPTLYLISASTFADTDSDGDPDLICGHGPGVMRSSSGVQGYSHGAISIHENRGGVFDGVPIESPVPITGRAILADMNKDGHLDLVGNNGVSLGTGQGRFGSLLPAPIASEDGKIVAFDANGDGNLDIAGTTTDHQILVRLGTAAGGVSAISSATLDGHFPTIGRITFAAGDLNEDGHADIVAGSEYYNYLPPNFDPVVADVMWWPGKGDGTFEAGRVIEDVDLAATSLEIRDLTGDGHADLVFTDFLFSAAADIVPGNGDGTFQPMRKLAGIDFTIYGGMHLDFGDVNSDGLEDAVIQAYQYSAPIAVALRRPDLTFAPYTRLYTSPFSTYSYDPVAITDMDGDGRNDLVARLGFGAGIGLGNGTGAFGARRFYGGLYADRLLVGDVNEDGAPDLVFTPATFSPDRVVRVFPNRAAIVNRRAARAFLAGGSKTVPVGKVGRDLCVRIEPVGGSFTITDLDLASVTMQSTGTGSVTSIAAIPPKRVVLGDADGNGVVEVEACFASADLGRLFSNLHGRQVVVVTIEGRLPGAPRARAEMALTIVPTGNLATAPSLGPNPLNPSGTFRFATLRNGRARIDVFDVQGRLVRTVIDRVLRAGSQEVMFDGKDRDGRSLASGVYFARIETTEGVYRHRLAIVK